MPPKKKGGSVSSGGSKKKKKGGKKKEKLVIPTEIILPAITSEKCATLQATVLARDTQSLSRLVVHYDHGRSLRDVDVNGSTLLHIAVKRGDIHMVEKLLTFNEIPINALELSVVGGHSALHHACLQNNPDIVSTILNAGAHPNLRSNNAAGETALIICCKHGYVACARELLRRGASLETRDNFGNNASFWAHEYHQLEIIRELNLPPPRTATADELIAIMVKRNPNFKLPSLKAKKSKKSGDGKKKGKKK